MKTFDTLYRRSKTGAIVYYKVSVDEGDIDHAPIIVKESGQLGTVSPVVHRETVYQGMNIGKSNETTPIQQAKLQAESDWKRKKDSGYKTYAEVMVSTTGGEAFAYARVTDQATIKEDLEHCLPEFNSDAQGNVKPMLVKDWKKVSKVEYPCFCEPKLDGVRCLMIISGEDITFLSRSGKEYTTLGHIDASMRANAGEVPANFVLDGEIYSDDLTFQEITQAVKKQYPNSLKLHFRAYDVVSALNQWDRRLQLINLTDAIGSEFVKRIEWTTVNSAEEVKIYHDAYVQQGYEGAMLRAKYGKYEQGFRSSGLLKVKEFNEEEFEFYGFTKGQREEDLIAICQTETGLVFNAKMIGSKQQKEEMVQEAIDKQLQHGSPITIKFFGWTTDGLPRFPVGKGLRFDL